MRLIFIRLIVFLTLIHFANIGYSQQYSFKYYTPKDGLANSNINNIFQDSKGYIWFCTQDGGVSRFNGKEFISFNKTNGLISNDLTCITEDKRGRIWIGYADGGVSCFDGIKFTYYSKKEGLLKGFVYGMYVDASNKVWFALRGGGGVSFYDGVKFHSFSTKDSLSSNNVYTISQDSKGNLWFGSANGIAEYAGSKFFKYNRLDNTRKKKFISSFSDNKGNIWFGTDGGEVVVKDSDNNFVSLILPDEIKGDQIGCITQDKRGNMWFATNNHGLLQFRQNKFRLFTVKEGISNNDVQSVISDYEDNIWIGTLGGGVNLFSNEAFVKYSENDLLKSNNVTAILLDTSANQFYIGTEGGGLNIFNPNTNPKSKKINGIKELDSISISSLSIDKKGLIWIAADNGVFILKKTKTGFKLERKYEKIAGQVLVSPQTIIHDSKGNSWITTYGSGLFMINDKEEKYFGAENHLSSLNLLTVFEDSKANIWVGTRDSGVFLYNGKDNENFKPLVGFPDKAVWTITEDTRGDIYFGTGESGLICFDGKKLITYTAKDEICSNYISVLQWDKGLDCLWLCTENGMNKIKFKNNRAIESIVSYKQAEGLNPNGINPNAIWVDSEGKIWLGTTGGLWCYNTKEDISKRTPPKIELTGVRLAYQKVDWKKYADSIDPHTNLPVNLVLSYKNNHLVFDIQALTTGDVSYKFKLEGQDSGWSPPTKNNELNFSNISPGKKYTFRAKAINSNGTTSKETIPFTFTINPPWWNTWWFRIGLLIITIASITVFIKARERVLIEQNVKLEKTVIERTAEVVHQKERSDSLLLNILPAEVAEELKETGKSDAKRFENVTVLFTDFKGFTTMSEKISPEELVKELDECFKAFDGIIRNYNIEKIKTIGDSYLAAAGVPVQNANHAEEMTNAAIEMRDFMINRKNALGEKTFEMRLGLNSGHVVAGIVGVKKFAYDIWGDTVNTAARMEQNGEAGKINISQSTYELIKGKFFCTPRGKLQAKNKGMIDQYFVEGKNNA